MLAPNSAIQAEYGGTCWSLYNTASDTIIYLPLASWANYDKPRNWPIRVTACTERFPVWAKERARCPCELRLDDAIAADDVTRE